SLRDRREDVPELLAHFLRAAQDRYPQSRVRGFSPKALERLREYRWPGNVRELAHTVEKLVLLGQSSEIGVDEVSELVTDVDKQSSLEFRGDIIPLREVDRRYAAWALAQTGGHRGKTAEKLGVDPKTLRKWLEESELVEATEKADGKTE
ncbi:MAG TPA: helix-turn-helix domain-containing protein, partial [Polyangia bacterium]|nr:helix-turn-helix domain-containing protein [Polyangia bacterium]